MLSYDKVKLVLIALLAGCASSPQKDKASDVKTEAAKSGARAIFQEEASKRAQQISDIAYKLDFDISGKGETFLGKVEVTFTSTKDYVWLDFDGGEIKNFHVNGADAVPHVEGRRIHLSGLQKGKNTVSIDYVQKYATNGAGLTKFTDPEDKAVYMYTQFEPFDANHLFPCFDQPDLKATYEMTVRAPSAWKVISAAPTQSVKAEKGAKLWTFKKSQKFSTYLISLIAGPFTEWTDQYKSGTRTVALKVYARKPIAKFARAREILDVTKKGMSFYEGYFGVPYPFEKYDQVLVPNFNWGGMENVGAVVYNERFANRGKVTQDDRERLAGTFLHELAHMWFGDLVTMKWWNDLWLNESFATFTSYKATQALGFTKTWQSFFMLKRGGYKQDLSVITHPIEGAVPTTDDAFASFDGITYNKGASALNQLNYMISDDVFKKGLKDYFTRHAFQNTTRQDFISAMERASKRDLSEWTDLWLKTAGANHIRPTLICKDGSLQSLTLAQSVRTGENVMRPHSFSIGYYGLKGNKLELTESTKVEVTKKTTEIASNNRACPVLTNLNQGDYGYFRYSLDPTTLKNFSQYYSQIPDELTRMQMWDVLWDMVREGELPVFDYSAIILAHVEGETSDKVLDIMMGSVLEGNSRNPTVQYYLSVDEAFAAKAKDFNSKLAKILYTKMMKSAPGSDFQKKFYGWYSGNVYLQTDPAWVVGLLNGTTKIPGLKIDQDMRWALIKKLATVGYKDTEKIADQELKRDHSDWGLKARKSVEVAMPTREAKLAGLNYLREDHPFGDQRNVMRSLFTTNQKQIHTQLTEDIFKLAKESLEKKDDYFMESYVEDLFPAYCESNSHLRLSDFQKNTNLSPAPMKELKFTLDEDQKCLQLKAQWLQNVNIKAEIH